MEKLISSSENNLNLGKKKQKKKHDNLQEIELKGKKTLNDAGHKEYEAK